MRFRLSPQQIVKTIKRKIGKEVRPEYHRYLLCKGESGFWVIFFDLKTLRVYANLLMRP